MWLTFSLCKKQHSPAPRRRPTFRPTLEALEGRWQPSALTLTVNSPGDSGTGTGTTGDLRYCINLANQNHNTSSTPDVIDASGVSGEVTLQQGELLISDPNLVINGPGASNLAITPSSYDPGGGIVYTSRVFEVSAGAQVQLSGMSIVNGSGIGGPGIVNDPAWAGYGGGIFNFGTLTLSGCTIWRNSASFGGGIYNAGTLTVTNSTLEHNTAGSESFETTYSGDGGAIYNGPGGKLTVSNSILEYNTAIFGNNSAAPGQGGGIFNASSGSATVTGSTVTGINYSGYSGIYNDGLMTLSGSTVSGNIDEGIYNDTAGNLTIESQSNVVGNYGNGIDNYGVMTLSGSTVSGNNGDGIDNNKQAYLTIESQSSVVNNTGYNLFNNHGHVKISKDSVVGK
jgi:hypothetical protein